MTAPTHRAAILLFVILICGCNHHRSAAPPSPAKPITYRLVYPKSKDHLPLNTLNLMADNDLIHVFHTQHAHDPGVYNDTWFPDAYKQLTPRDRYLKHQPKPLDDITGDGLPNLVIMESYAGGTAPGSPQYWLTVLTLRGHSVEMAPPIHEHGEVFFFDDLNGDGRLEFIAGELDYSKLGKHRTIPDSPLVWVYDPDQRRYRRADRMHRFGHDGQGH